MENKQDNTWIKPSEALPKEFEMVVGRYVNGNSHDDIMLYIGADKIWHEEQLGIEMNVEAPDYWIRLPDTYK
jgi:hypothetical protein